MFDDLKNMAEEAAGQLTFNHLHNIHLYNLNGVYVPASMLLSYVYTALSNAATTIDSGYTAQAFIDTSAIDANIREWVSAYSGKWPGNSAQFKAEWPRMAEAAASGTKVQITFLASFIQLVQGLLKL